MAILMSSTGRRTWRKSTKWIDGWRASNYEASLLGLWVLAFFVYFRPSIHLFIGRFTALFFRTIRFLENFRLITKFVEDQKMYKIKVERLLKLKQSRKIKSL